MLTIYVQSFDLKFGSHLSSQFLVNNFLSKINSKFLFRNSLTTFLFDYCLQLTTFDAQLSGVSVTTNWWSNPPTHETLSKLNTFYLTWGVMIKKPAMSVMGGGHRAHKNVRNSNWDIWKPMGGGSKFFKNVWIIN